MVLTRQVRLSLLRGTAKLYKEAHHPLPLPNGIAEAHEEVPAKGKLTLIFRSKTAGSADTMFIGVGKLVEIFMKLRANERGKWLFPRTALSIDADAGTVAVPGANSTTICDAAENVRVANVTDNLAQLAQA